MRFYTRHVGDLLAFLGVALAAAIGGSGLGGLLADVTSWSKRARLRRHVLKAHELRAISPEGSQARALLTRAVEIDSARLASLSIVVARPRRPAIVAYSISIALVLLVVLAAPYLNNWDNFRSSVAPVTPERVILTVLLAATATSMIVAQILSRSKGSLGRRRASWVAQALGDDGPVEL